MMAVEDVLGDITAKQDIKDAVFKKLAEIAYEDDKQLLRVSRPNKEQAVFIIKNLIVVNFFQRFFEKARVRITLTRTDTPPYYKRHVSTSISPSQTSKSYMNLINDYQKILIAVDGKGRDELFGLARALTQSMSDEGQSFWRRLMPGGGGGMPR